MEEATNTVVDREINTSAMQVSNEVAIQINEMNKWYGSFHVLRDINLTVNRGERIVVCGPSGSGKSTLIRCINRLEEHQAGQIIVDGEDIVPLGEVELARVRRKFGMVFQLSALFDSMSIFDNVAFLLREHTRMRRKEIRERIMDRLAVLGVDHAAQKMPAELSPSNSPPSKTASPIPTPTSPTSSTPICSASFRPMPLAKAMRWCLATPLLLHV